MCEYQASPATAEHPKLDRGLFRTVPTPSISNLSTESTTSPDPKLVTSSLVNRWMIQRPPCGDPHRSALTQEQGRSVSLVNGIT